jgi:hypothetical protein
VLRKKVPGMLKRKKAWTEVFKVLERVQAQHPPSTLSPRQEEEWIAKQVKAFRKARHSTRHASRRTGAAARV